jgi:hypothetical protein
LAIEHSLRWDDPDRFNGYLLSQHLAGTPVDAVNLRDALGAVKERAPLQFGALRHPAEDRCKSASMVSFLWDSRSSGTGSE